jgi:YegS/Rv2252/BmrU family lipid kinase
MKQIKRKKFCILVNPVAGGRKTTKIFTKIQKLFDTSSVQSVKYFSDRPGFITDFIINSNLSEFDGLCVVGGDGTIHEAVLGLMKSGKAKSIPLGIIPGGTGNAFIEDLGCRDPIKAANRIIDGQVSPIDIFQIVHNEATSYAFNIIGWGMASDVNILAEQWRWLGGMRYSISAIINIMAFFKKRHLQLNLADNLVNSKCLFFVALNTIHTGKGMKMAPHAKLNDGLIDTILVRDVSKLRAVKIFTQVFSGNHIFDPSVEYQQVKTFSIHTKGDFLNIDGENTGHTPINVSVVPNALKIFADL